MRQGSGENAAGRSSGPPPAGAPVPQSTALPLVSRNIARAASKMLVKPHPASAGESDARNFAHGRYRAHHRPHYSMEHAHRRHRYAGQDHGSVDLDEHHAND